MKAVQTILAALMLLILCASTAHAGAGNRAGSNGAAELLVPVGARDIGMGGATIATTRGVEALFWNPAGVARMNSSAALYVSHMSYIADIGVNYGAVAADFEGFGTLALNLKSLAIGEIPVTTTLNPDGTGRTFTPQFFTVGLTYARQLNDRIAVGVTSMLISERMAEVSASGIAFSAGVMYDNLGGLNGVSIGVAVKNVGPQMTFAGSGLLTEADGTRQHRPPQLYQVQVASFELPSSIEFGLGYKRQFGGENTVQLSGAFQNQNFSDDEYRLGVEYAYQDLFFLRGGYNFAQEESALRPFIFGPSFGAGIHTALGSLDVTFDYAFRKVDVFDNNHTFAVKLGF